MLFAFLLTVPFTPRFPMLTNFQSKLYFATLLCSAAASVLLIAPTAHHRVQFRQRQKEQIVKVANRFALTGLAALALAMTGVVLLITDVMFGALTTAVASLATGLAFLVMWFALPLARRLSRRGD